MKTALFSFLILLSVVFTKCELKNKVEKEADKWLEESKKWLEVSKKQREQIASEYHELEAIKQKIREIDRELANKNLPASIRQSLEVQRKQLTNRLQVLQTTIKGHVQQAQDKDKQQTDKVNQDIATHDKEWKSLTSGFFDDFERTKQRFRQDCIRRNEREKQEYSECIARCQKDKESHASCVCFSPFITPCL